MFRNYLLVAYRTLKRNKTFSFINFLGLTIGTICFLYILLYVRYHRNFDRHHSQIDLLYRIISDLDLANDGEVLHMATCSPPIAPGLQEDYPEVEMVTRACSHPSLEQNLIRIGEKVFYEKKGLYVDSTFFRMFDYHFIEGDPTTALNEPYTMVISSRLAAKLFDKSSALGEVINIGGGGSEQPFKIMGVYDDALGESHLMPEFFIAMNSGGIGQFIRTNNSWAGNNFIYGYVKLRPGTDPVALEAKLPAFLLAHGADQLRQLGMKKALHLQPVKEIHTGSGLNADMADNTSATFLNILLIIAGFIQLVACINFMNLTTARSTKRAQEVGIRKTVGAPRTALMGQFLGESVLLSAISMLFAIPVLQLLLPLINAITGTGVEIQLTASWGFILLLAFLIILTGLVAGSYPAFYLSSFQPLQVLRNKGMVSGRDHRGWLRKGLVVGQFTIAIILVIGALIIRSQLHYMLEKDLGFERSNKIVVPFHSQETMHKLELFKHELLQYPEVLSASAMSKYPGQKLVNDLPMYREGEDMNSAVDIRFNYVDSDFFRTLKINVQEGRELLMSDTTKDGSTMGVVLNETAIKRLGIRPQDAPGMQLFSQFEDLNFRAIIIGVMDDVIYQDLSNEVTPFMVAAEPIRNLQYLVADVSTADYHALTDKMEATWKRIIPDFPFEFSFLDDNINNLYKTEQSLSRIITVFTFIAIFISCLGLFGLSVFAAEQRRKEIGIRKVLGASTLGIVRILSFDFLKLVLVALVVASPLAYYFMDQWLGDFAYRIPVSGSYFIWAGVAALIISFFTVSFQSVRAALVNPSQSLKSE